MLWKDILFTPGMPTNPDSSSPFTLADDHKGLVLRWDPMRSVLPKPNSNGMPIYIFSVRLSSKPVQHIFQQLYLPKHWLSLLCTYCLLIFILLIYKCRHWFQYPKILFLLLKLLNLLGMTLEPGSFTISCVFLLPAQTRLWIPWERGSQKLQHLIQTDRQEKKYLDRKTFVVLSNPENLSKLVQNTLDIGCNKHMAPLLSPACPLLEWLTSSKMTRGGWYLGNMGKYRACLAERLPE